MASKTADAFKFVLRLPKPLHKRLKQQARRNNVSLNTEIVSQLEGHEAATLQQVKQEINQLNATTALLEEVVQTFRGLLTGLGRLVRAVEEKAVKEAEAAIREGRPRRPLEHFPTTLVEWDQEKSDKSEREQK
jgi:hypothetical protein